MIFKLTWEMKVLDSELLEMVNNSLYDEDDIEDDDYNPYTDIKDVPEQLIIDAMDAFNFIQEEISDYCERSDVDVQIIKNNDN